jgi:hypothetical protein
MARGRFVCHIVSRLRVARGPFVCHIVPDRDYVTAIRQILGIYFATIFPYYSKPTHSEQFLCSIKKKGKGLQTK